MVKFLLNQLNQFDWINVQNRMEPKICTTIILRMLVEGRILKGDNYAVKKRVG